MVVLKNLQLKNLQLKNLLLKNLQLKLSAEGVGGGGSIQICDFQNYTCQGKFCKIGRVSKKFEREERMIEGKS